MGKTLNFPYQMVTSACTRCGAAHETIDGGSLRAALAKLEVTPSGADPSEWPEDLRVREFPEVTRV